MQSVHPPFMGTLHPQTLEFIRRHADDDVRQLALHCPPTELKEVDLPFALDQIRGRQTARQKLPTWAATEGIVYPPHLSMEQCSSEATALYKAETVRRLVALPPLSPLASSPRTPGRFVDLTGGFGVDFSYVSQGFQERIYVEQNRQLCAISSENFKRLGLAATVVCGDGVEYLHQMPQAEVIYLDPARRDSHGGRTYGIADCQPDVAALGNLLLEKARWIVVKLSPMLDWRQAVRELPEVREVHIVAVQGECKELLLVLGREAAERRLVCADLGNSHWEVPMDGAGNPAPVAVSQPLDSQFLHVPNAAVMKSGCFPELERAFGVKALAANSHLFVADHAVEGFPGRVFRIGQVTTMNKKELRRALAGVVQANIAVRNFPLSAAELRKRLKLRDGGDTYLFATTLANGLHVVIVGYKVVRL